MDKYNEIWIEEKIKVIIKYFLNTPKEKSLMNFTKSIKPLINNSLIDKSLNDCTNKNNYDLKNISDKSYPLGEKSHSIYKIYNSSKYISFKSFDELTDAEKFCEIFNNASKRKGFL